MKINDYPPHIFRGNTSVIPTLAQYNHEISKKAISGFSAIQTNVPLLQKHDLDWKKIIDFYVSDEKTLQELNSKIRMLDLGIDEVVIGPGYDSSPAPYFRYFGLNGELPFFAESQGTQKFFTLFPR